MPETVDAAQLEAFLREQGLIPADYSGQVVISTTTDEGSASFTIIV